MVVVVLLEEDEEIIVSSLFGLVGRLSAANATVSKPFPNTTLWKALKSKGLC